MLILSNCLTDKADEGCLKVANSLVKRIKKASDNTTVISYERTSKLTDVSVTVNKLLMSRELRRIVSNRKEEVLYFPFPAKMISTALRIFMLSLFARYGLKVVLIMQSPVNLMSKLLLRFSRAELVVLSKSAYDFYHANVGDRVTYLKAGVDTQRFTPVDHERQTQLKEKYGIPSDRTVVLHVGHLKYGRNIEELLKIDPSYHLVLVVSTLTKDECDSDLRQKFLNRPNTTLIDTYVSDIEEIYQMCDVYFFPVLSPGNCIDIPLSAMEAASCNKPVITTDYGEMREISDKSGFYLIESFHENTICSLIKQALNDKEINSRETALEYDWNNAIEYFIT